MDIVITFSLTQWHEIHAVKAKNVVTLSVNKIFAQPGKKPCKKWSVFYPINPGIGVPGVSSTDTNNPLFLGGHPRFIHLFQALMQPIYSIATATFSLTSLFRPGKFSIRGDQVNYSGCMKEVVIEGKPVEMTADRLIGDIHSHVCPTI